MARRYYYRRRYYRPFRRFRRFYFRRVSFSNMVTGKFKRFLSAFFALIGVFIVVILFFKMIPTKNKQQFAYFVNNLKKSGEVQKGAAQSSLKGGFYNV